jgi:predicted O-methyltransferase YrrM
MSEYQFTKDWFQWSPPVWKQLIPHLPERKSFLEIGSFEGRSTVWTIENMMDDGGEIVCIDTWEGGAEHVNNEMDGAELRFEHNINTVREKHPERRVTKCRGLSTQWLPAVTQEKYLFDFIYIDGSHIAKDVLTDACMSWPLLKRGGFMAFDDYMWKPPGFTLLDRPKFAVDVFTTLFENELLLAHSGYQLIVRKV